MTPISLAEPVSDLCCELGEGPVWVAATGRLSWVDVLAGRLHSAAWTDGALTDLRTLQHDAPVGAAAPRRGGGWVLAAGTGFVLVSPGDRVTGLIEAEPGRAGSLRMNDGKCDPAGRFFAGSMAYDGAEGAGSFFRLAPNGEVTRVLEETSISNGLAWSADGRTLYWIDTPTGRLTAFDYDPETGDLGESRVFLQAAPGESPDGMTVDAEDGVWIAYWGSGAVRRFDRAGEPTDVVELPVTQPTCPTLGGNDLRTLFVTTAYHGLGDEGRERQPLAGRVFACEVDVPGQPTAAFAG